MAWLQVVRSLACWSVLVVAAIATRGAAQESGGTPATAGAARIADAGGGRLVPWAPITGDGARAAAGAPARETVVHLPGVRLNTTGAAIGLYRRLELSYAHEWLYTGAPGERLGLGRDFRFHPDIAGATPRHLADAVEDGESWLPGIVVGARTPDRVEAYIGATRRFLAQSVLIDATLHERQARRSGPDGDAGDTYHAGVRGSAVLLLARRLGLGADPRTGPETRFAGQGDSCGLVAAYFRGTRCPAGTRVSRWTIGGPVSG